MASGAWASTLVAAKTTTVHHIYVLEGDADMGTKVTVRLITSDGVKYEIPEEIMEMSDVLRNMVEFSKKGEEDIRLEMITSTVWEKILVWAEYNHGALPIDDQKFAKRMNRGVMSVWEKKFVNVEEALVFKIFSAAHYLNIKRLYDLMCRAVAHLINDLSPAQIREKYGLPNDNDRSDEELLRDNPWCADGVDSMFFH